MKVIETIWFTSFGGCVGIVVGEDEVSGDRRAYIAPVRGFDEKADIEAIKRWGNNVSLDRVKKLLSLLTVKED